jgi:hypothetical protein
VSARAAEPRWDELTVRVPPAWASIVPAALGVDRALWTAMGVPVPPLIVVADPAVAAGAVEVVMRGESLATAHGDDPTVAITQALVACMQRWMTPALAGTLFDLAVPLETLERFTAAIPPAVQAALLGRLVADQVSVRDLTTIAETCLAVGFDAGLDGNDLATRDGDAWLDLLELASRLALRRTISLQLLDRARIELIVPAFPLVVAVARDGEPVATLVAAIEQAGGARPSAAVVVPIGFRRRLRDLLAPWLPGVPVIATEELIASPRWKVVAVGAADAAASG